MKYKAKNTISFTNKMKSRILKSLEEKDRTVHEIATKVGYGDRVNLIGLYLKAMEKEGLIIRYYNGLMSRWKMNKEGE